MVVLEEEKVAVTNEEEVKKEDHQKGEKIPTEQECIDKYLKLEEF